MSEWNVLWEIHDMWFCKGDLQERNTYGDFKSVIDVPGDGQVHELSHGIRFMNLDTDEFVLELGEVSPWIEWELGARPLDRSDEFRLLFKGQGGGTHRAPLAKIGLPRYAGNDIVLKVRSEKPGTMEILRWAVLTPSPIRFAEEHQRIARQLTGATPLERGITKHWNPIIGGFVCACNYTHPEHYNYWLEDEGEQLWSFGNYPKFMEIYGRKMRDYIVERCRHGAPVRRANDQPLYANPFLADGKFHLDTGLLDVSGDLAEDPHIDLHHSVYEAHGLLARIADFFVTYKKADGSAAQLGLAKPSAFDIAYHSPSEDRTRLTVEAEEGSVRARFIVDIFRSRATVSAAVTNRSGQALRDVAAGFAFRDVEHYYKHPLNTVKRYGGVTILYCEQPRLEDCNLIRVAGPAADGVEVVLASASALRSDTEASGQIARATASAELARELGAGTETVLKLADINAGSTCLASKIDNYRDVDYDDADISMSYVGTYALLGLATYSYRFPDDREARESVNMMIDSFLMARDRARDRELGYLLWVLCLYGREKDAEEIADLLEKRLVGKKLNSLDGSAVSMGMRCAGRWAVADKIGNSLEPFYTEGVAAPTDLVGLGCLQSPATLERAYLQLTNSLYMMYWDSPEGITTHNYRVVEEGPQETNCYLLVALDLIHRLYGGIAPIRLDIFAKTQITGMKYDGNTGEWRLKMTNSNEVDLFTHFRAPKRILWNGAPLPAANWRYGEEMGVIYVTGLSGDGELVVTVEGEAPEADWEPIDYVGLGKR